MSDFREELIEAMAQDLRHRMGLSSAAFDHDHPLPGLACTPEFLMECALAVAESFRQTVECPECGGTGTVEVGGDEWSRTIDTEPCPAGCIDGRVPNQTRLAIVERQVGVAILDPIGGEQIVTLEHRQKEPPAPSSSWPSRPVFLLAPDLPEGTQE